MPLSEHPSDESWGYQNTGFFAPTSRYGTPRQLQKFVDLCHQNQTGVLLDFVPVHFAVDDYALWNYDGTALYLSLIHIFSSSNDDRSDGFFRSEWMRESDLSLIHI